MRQKGEEEGVEREAEQEATAGGCVERSYCRLGDVLSRDVVWVPSLRCSSLFVGLSCQVRLWPPPLSLAVFVVDPWRTRCKWPATRTGNRAKARQHRTEGPSGARRRWVELGRGAASHTGPWTDGPVVNIVVIVSLLDLSKQLQTATSSRCGTPSASHRPIVHGQGSMKDWPHSHIGAHLERRWLSHRSRCKWGRLKLMNNNS